MKNFLKILISSIWNGLLDAMDSASQREKLERCRKLRYNNILEGKPEKIPLSGDKTIFAKKSGGSLNFYFTNPEDPEVSFFFPKDYEEFSNICRSVRKSMKEE